MNRIYLSLGSNMNQPERQLQKAQEHISRQVGIVVRSSSIYQTAAWGKTDQPDFLNQVLIVESEKPAPEVMQVLLGIEKKMGRIRTEKNAPRVIDIDILFFNHDMMKEKDLLVPHPQVQNRRFVLVPLNQLSPNFRHPVLKKTIHQLLQECADPLNVKKF